MKKALIVSALLLSPALAQSATPIIPVPSVEVAKIGDKSLSLEDFEKQFRITAARVLNSQGQPYSAEAAASLNPYRGEILQQYVNQQAVLLEAAQKGVVVTEAEVEAQYSQTVSQFPSPEALQEALGQSGIASADELRTLIRDGLTVQKYVEAQEGRFVYTDTVLRGYYNANAANYRKAAQACVKHILLPTAEEAQKAKARLEAGEDFGKVAQELSQDPGSAQQGGDLGCLNQGETVPEFDKASFEGPLNALQQVKSQFGEHLLIVSSRTPANTVPFATARAGIQKTLAQGAANRYVQGAAKRLNVVVYAERVAKEAPAAPAPQ